MALRTYQTYDIKEATIQKNAITLWGEGYINEGGTGSMKGNFRDGIYSPVELERFQLTI